MQVITMLKQKIRCAQILVRKKLFSKTILHNKGNNNITELRAILQRESHNS